MVNDVGGDVVTRAKFQIEIFMGYDFTGGRILNFPLILARALQQCSANAMPVKSAFSAGLTTAVSCEALER